MTTTKTKKTKKAKKAAPVTALPGNGSTDEITLPRGQEMLPDGVIRLKTGPHKLGKELQIYDVHGARVELSGSVMVATIDCDWLSIGKCQKCGTARPHGIKIEETTDGLTVLTFTCGNKSKKDCDLSGVLYVQVHSKGRFFFE